MEKITYKEVHDAAASQIGTYCKNCDVCNGKACANSMPGPGCKAPGNTALRNYEKWQEVCINMDTLTNVHETNTAFNLFGKDLVAPILIAPLGSINMHYGSKYNDFEYNAIMLKKAYEYGTIGFTGDGLDDEIMIKAVAEMVKIDGFGIPTIKPWANEKIFEKLDILNKNRIFAAAMDIDGAGLPFVKGAGLSGGGKDVESLKQITSYAQMPFIIKGIMTPKAAEKAAESGAKAIVVSNHGGRVQGGCPSTCEVLPSIAQAVKGDLTILVDGGIRSGVDVFRALALGADAVLIGRPILNMIYGNAQYGVKVYMDKIISELKDTMTMCGVSDIHDISKENIWNP